MTSPLLLLLLFICASLSSPVAGQGIIDDGVLPNGVTINMSIAQGESQYWSFFVSPSDPSTGSSLSDLSITVLTTSGQLALAITTPSGAVLQPTWLGGGIGVLVINRTVLYSDGNLTAPDGTTTTYNGNGGGGSQPSQWGQLQYGSYLVQVFSGQQNTYTISASLYRRPQLITGVASPVALVNSTVNTAITTYAEYIWNCAGPVVMTVTLLMDVAVAFTQGAPLSSLQLPSLYWARNAQPTSWSPSTYALGSLMPAVGQVDALLTIEDDCITPPCQYSFLLVNPSSTSLPSAPSLTVNANWTVDTQLDYEFSNTTDNTNGTTILITTTPISLLRGQVRYHMFEVLDAQAAIVLTLSGCGAPGVPLDQFVVLVSNSDGLPDQTAGGSQYSLSSVQLSASTLQPSTMNITISPADVTFSPSGPSVGQLITMEGLYYIAVLAHTSGCYQLSLNVTDQANETAAVLSLDQPLVGVLAPQQLLFSRFSTPRDFDALATDIVLTTVNASLWVSDVTSTPGPTSDSRLILAQSSYYPTGGVTSVIISSSSSQVHSGTYYVGVYNLLTMSTPFSLVVTFFIHTQLSANSTWESDQPLVPSSVRYFEYIQAGLTAETVLITVNTSDPSASAGLYISFTGRALPYSTDLGPYPTPGSSNTYTSSATGMTNGVLQLSVPWTCLYQFSCVWQITLAPVANGSTLSPVGLQSYSIQMQVASGVAAANVQINSSVTGGFEPVALYTQASMSKPYQFVVDSYSLYRVTLQSQSTYPAAAPTLQLLVDSDHVLVSSPYGNQAQYVMTSVFVPLTNRTVSQSTVTISPSDPVFGLRSLPNQGAPFLGVWWVVIVCQGNCALMPNYTLSVTQLPYTGNVSVLIPQPINSTSAVSFNLQARQYAFYSFVCPSSLSADTDITVAVGPTSLSEGNTYGGPDIFISPINPLPTIQNFNFTNVIFNSGASQSITLSNDDNTLPQPSALLFISVYAARLTSLTSTIKVTVSERLRMTGNAVLSLPSPITPGTTQLVEMTLVGQSNPSLYVSNSFVYSVVSPNTSSLLPTCNLASLLSNTDSWQSSFGILFQNVQFNPSAVNWWRQSDHCSRYVGTCVYKFLLYFPSALPSATFAINGLNQTQSATSNIATQPLDPVSTLTDTLQSGETRFYSVQVPLASIFTAIVNITVQPLTSTADPNLLVTAGTGVVPIYYGWRGQAQSTRPAGFNDTVTMTLQYPYVPVVYIQLQGVQAGPFTLSVNITSPAVAQPLTGVITLDRSVPDQLLVASFNATNRDPPVWQLTIPPDFDSKSDLYITAASTAFSTSVSTSLWTFKNVYPYQPANLIQQLFYSQGLSFVVGTLSFTNPSQLLRSTQLYAPSATPVGINVQPGDVLYIVVGGVVANSAVQLSVSYSQRTPLTVSSSVNGALSVPFSGRAFTLTVPAVAGLGGWRTSVRFFAALTLTSGGGGSSASPVIFRAPLNLYATISHTPRAPVPYGSQSATSPYLGSDLSSTNLNTWQFIDVQDVCTLSTCSYSLLVTDNLLNVSALTYSLTVSQPSPALILVPGLATAPTFIGTGSMQFYQLTMPHADMSAVISLQTLFSYNATSTGNADLYIGWQNAAYQYPTPSRSMGQSNADDSTGFDSFTLNVATTSRSLRQGDPVYIGVFGERAATYTLLIQLIDYGSPNPYITNNQLVTDSVSGGAVSYYQYPLGAVTAATDLSILLLPQSGQGRIFGTFSYSHPGPVNGVLPASLPYEMLTNASSGVGQLTLTQKLSSSNLLPLHSQSTLYVAVASVDQTTILQYSLSVSLSQRVALQGDSSSQSSATFARVSAGSVQYFAVSFNLPLQPANMQALLVLTALQSPLSALPTVYVTNSILSPLVDPVISNPATYTASAGPAVGALSAFNALTIPMASLCPSSVTFSCVWKVMVPALVDLSSYTVAVNTFVDSDQTPLLLNSPVMSSVASGRFTFFVFTAPAAATSLTLSLRSLDSEGNADLFVSTIQSHPSSASYQWASLLDSSNSADSVVLLPSDPLFVLGGVYYVAVFGQRTTAYQLSLTDLVPFSSSSSSSTAPGQSTSPTSPSTASSQTSTPSSPSTTSSGSPSSSSNSPSLLSSSSSTSFIPSSSSSFSPAVTATPSLDGDDRSSSVSLAVFLPVLIILSVLVLLLACVLVVCVARRDRSKPLLWSSTASASWLALHSPRTGGQANQGGAHQEDGQSENTAIEMSRAGFVQDEHSTSEE